MIPCPTRRRPWSGRTSTCWMPTCTATFEFGDAAVDVRLGKHVLNWGESTFIQNGINAVNPFDVSKLRVPGRGVARGVGGGSHWCRRSWWSCPATCRWRASTNSPGKRPRSTRWAPTSRPPTTWALGRRGRSSPCEPWRLGDMPHDQLTPGRIPFSSSGGRRPLSLAASRRPRNSDRNPQEDHDPRQGQWGMAFRYLAEEPEQHRDSASTS